MEKVEEILNKILLPLNSSMWRKNTKSVNIKEVNQVIETFDRHQKGIINAITTNVLFL